MRRLKSYVSVSLVISTIWKSDIPPILLSTSPIGLHISFQYSGEIRDGAKIWRICCSHCRHILHSLREERKPGGERYLSLSLSPFSTNHVEMGRREWEILDLRSSLPLWNHHPSHASSVLNGVCAHTALCNVDDDHRHCRKFLFWCGARW